MFPRWGGGGGMTARHSAGLAYLAAASLLPDDAEPGRGAGGTRDRRRALSARPLASGASLSRRPARFSVTVKRKRKGGGKKKTSREGEEGGGSDHVDRRRRPLAAVGGAGVARRAAVHVRRLELHLAGRDRRVQLHLRPVDHVKHQADADDDLQGRNGEVRPTPLAAGLRNYRRVGNAAAGLQFEPCLRLNAVKSVTPSFRRRGGFKPGAFTRFASALFPPNRQAKSPRAIGKRCASPSCETARPITRRTVAGSQARPHWKKSWERGDGLYSDVRRGQNGLRFRSDGFKPSGFRLKSPSQESVSANERPFQIPRPILLMACA